MAVDELTRALLLEEAASRSAVAEALFTAVSGAVPLLEALVDSGATDGETLDRYLARSDAPFIRQVVPVDDLVDQLPRGLCTRLLALPIRRDPVTGTVDVAVADASDAHPAEEIRFHLQAPVRLVRAPLAALEEALRRLRIRLREDRPVDRFREAAENASREHENDLYDSRRRGRADDPPPEKPRHALLLEPDSSPPSAVPVTTPRMRTPPWGTPVHVIEPLIRRPGTEPPRSDDGSEIPIPLTRKSLRPTTGGTQRPPAMVDPARSGLGEGYAIDTTGFRDVVEKAARLEMPSVAPLGSFIPGPPPLPGSLGQAPPQLPFPETSGVLAALRNAGSRDEVLELVLAGARMVAFKVALFVVKKGGYHGWAGSPEFGERSALQAVVIPLEASSIFDRATREDVYLGPVARDEVHAPLLRVLRNPSRDVAAVPVRVSGKTAVIIVADELGDTMIGTRRLEELAKFAGDAFTRIVRNRR